MPPIILPPPRVKDTFPLEEAVYKRKSIREFKRAPLSLPQLSRLLWSAQGLRKGSSRTVPSAGATYPLEVLALISKDGVEAMAHGLFQYVPADHSLNLMLEKDLRKSLSVAAINQDFIRGAPVVLVITAEFSRIGTRYGQRGWRYIYIEAGHVGQNVSLMAVTMGLGSVMVGAFYDEQVKKILDLKPHSEPLYIIPVGYPAV